MDPALPSNSLEKSDAKPSFRKPAQDAVNRKYRRHTPTGGSDSSLSGGSPKRRSRSPVYSDDRRRRDDRRELERDSNHNRSSRGTDSHRHSDKHSHGASLDHVKNADYGRHHKHADEEDRGYNRSSRSGREAKSGTNSDCTRHDGNSDRSREIWRSGDKYLRDKSENSGHRRKDKEYKHYDKDSDRVREARDERRDRRRSPDDYKNDRRSSREEPRGYGKDSSFGRESGSTRLKDAALSGSKEIDVLKDKRKHDDRESDKRKEKMSKESEAEVKTKASQNFSTSLKKLKHYDSEDENPSLSLKQVKGAAEKFTSEPVSATGNQSETAQDLNAAKVAAMKAAELVNRNLVGGSSNLSTDQKKKLLWGNKKNTSTEESGNHWDLQLFADRERQEKFNKLMGVKGDAVPERKPNEMDAEKKQKLEMDLEKQYTAGLRRRDGRTVGLGL